MVDRVGQYDAYPIRLPIETVKRATQGYSHWSTERNSSGVLRGVSALMGSPQQSRGV